MDHFSETVAPTVARCAFDHSKIQANNSAKTIRLTKSVFLPILWVIGLKKFVRLRLGINKVYIGTAARVFSEPQRSSERQSQNGLSVTVEHSRKSALGMQTCSSVELGCGSGEGAGG